MVDTQTGFIFNPTRRAFDRGLTFRLVPRQTDHSYRLEVKGSLHKFHNNGQHNADQYTVNDLLLTLDQLVADYGFDLFRSKINGLEFGVNVELPFPVSQVLKNLVSYKNQPFHLDTSSETPYYVCQLQRYAVKIYDKGKQKGLNCHLLRFEIRVKKMEYFNGTGVKLRTLTDLLTVSNYKPLGTLLIYTFDEILFDDPTINTANLTPANQEVYRNGCNPRYWQIPDDLPLKQANTYRQQISRAKRRYRALFDQYGGQWQRETAMLIIQTWNHLTVVDDSLLVRINEYLTVWRNLAKPDIAPDLLEPIISTSDLDFLGDTCHELTDSVSQVRENLPNTTCHKLTNPSLLDLSRINSRLDCDSNQPSKTITELPTQPFEPGEVICPITGIVIDCPRPRRRFVSATQLKNLHTIDRPTFDNIAAQFLTLKQAGYTLDRQCYFIAHNIRNTYANQFNNPLRRLKKYVKVMGGQKHLLFPFHISKSQLTDQIQAGIEYRKGTRYDIVL